MRKENKKNKGFSLVELIIVIAIMVILGAIIAPQYFKHVKNANISSDVEQAARISAAISAEYASQQSGAEVPTGSTTLVGYDTTTPTAEWVAVSAIDDIVGTVQESKVEKDSEFFYSLSVNGDVRIAIGTAADAIDETDHIIAPMNTDADNLWD